ncbi:hypothetical protein ANOM_003678 [Aspergillus nomiae NRRL 13137]|uniref:Azaphilone pigments biosynthesis cluster protein L N-terminal domain-containing protein n=1 Tax=Aspergillus nomiae NRRL (strain ATCC 15546 / NRRL 13137 / CBS 260.88 / M93) TaxID=1509407 RepID=A0A0L1JAR7_ASPN3|nr:uncharacterized protein ANOM_003678 [Aspergillus nomiae NRRL 13137]KNG88886.1 hypothetical protein ANOM_003678 [Aspergillus nomiae NRRL 13137]
MAEAIGAASGITTFVGLALQSSFILYQTVRGLHSRDRMIRELRTELQDLLEVLETLKESIGNLDVDLTALQEPLTRCSNACGEFDMLIKECIQHSTEGRASRRDWLRLKYMGQDISGFKDMLAGYKSTIIIALAHANLRTTEATKGVLQEYKELIENTKYDLENHLQDIQAMLLSSSETSVASVMDAVELQRMEEERNSTQKSLDICHQFLAFITQTRANLLGESGLTLNDSHQPYSSATPNLSWLINAEGLNSTYKEVTSWRLRLLQHLYGFSKNVQAAPLGLLQPNNGQSSKQQSFQEEYKNTEALLAFCQQAEEAANGPRTHHFEDITTGDHSRQVIVTTLNDLISAKRIKSGHQSYQAVGQMSNESIQAVFLRPKTSEQHEGEDNSEAFQPPAQARRGTGKEFKEGQQDYFHDRSGSEYNFHFANREKSASPPSGTH